MIKIILFWIFVLLVSGSARAKDTCADIHGEQAYPSLSIKKGVICFIVEPVLDSESHASIGVDSINLYYLANEGAPVRAEGRGLLYDETPGQIIDAFSMIVGGDRQEKIFVIHSVDIRTSLVEPNSSGKFYSVDVFYLAGNILRRDDRASEWFGSDYSYLSNGARVIYKYPYQSRIDVRQAIDSPFASLMSEGGGIPVRVKYKSYLADGPDIRSRTKRYLIAGDRATVGKATGGWCQVSHSGGTKLPEMWLTCAALEPIASR
ncbi:hypothetical protein [Burkholderia latens]|uniref:hypothetical protein n=1 Tax=Burkholderia latens TaxID=488446 RepID=UPI001AE9EB20|nr:hypothetical protein [Burkholderia latens]QTO44919.1 hypothetical protein J8I85_20835 [Burkholderia latens]